MGKEPCIKKNNKKIGLGIAALGVLVIMALVMPTGFWVFAIGVALICTGICICRK